MCAQAIHLDAAPESLRAPAMLFLAPNDALPAHAVIYAGATGDEVIILDPLHGREAWTRGELSARWRGHAVECARGP